MSYAMMLLAIPGLKNVRQGFSPTSVPGLQAWVSTTHGSFLFGDGTKAPGHGKAVHEAYNVANQAMVFTQGTASLRPTWDSVTFDVPCVRSTGAQYLARGAAYPEPGLVIVAAALDSLTGFRGFTGARATSAPGGDTGEDSWALRRHTNGTIEVLISTTTGQFSATTPQITGEKVLILMEVAGTGIMIWQVGAKGTGTLTGTRIASDGGQAMLAKYYADLIASIMEGGIFEFAHYAPAPSADNRRLLISYFQSVLWPGVAPPNAADVDAGQIPQGQSRSVNVITPSSGASLLLTSIEEPPAVGTAVLGGNSDVVVSVPAGAAVGNYSVKYCLRSNVATRRLTDFGDVAFEVVPASPTGGDLPEDAPLPEATAIRNATTATFAAQYAALVPGEHLVLANGNYGAVTLNRTAPAGPPFVIRAATPRLAVFTTLVMSGGNQIVSGIDINAGTLSVTATGLNVTGSNVRVTRCNIRNHRFACNFGGSAHDILIDHCDISRFHDRGFRLGGPERRITVARCWIHAMLDSPSTDPAVNFTTCHCFTWTESNSEREVPFDTVVRLNYLGPGFPAAGNTDYVHHKGSKSIYAFNRFELGTASRENLLSARFGLRARWVGNHAPNARFNAYDSDGWYYGNVFSSLRCFAGSYAYYDDTKNMVMNAGGFHAHKRSRLSANNTGLVLGFDAGADWCTADILPGLPPDAQPAGGIKPARSNAGINYLADDPNHPDTGIKIRAHLGAITTDTGLPCITGGQVHNLDSQPANQNPEVAWLTALLGEYPWIADICPNPTKLDGGPGGDNPWTVAQGLVRGDLANPSVGPLRNSPGGSP